LISFLKSGDSESTYPNLEQSPYAISSDSAEAEPNYPFFGTLGPIGPLSSLRIVEIADTFPSDFINHLAQTSPNLEEAIIRDVTEIPDVWMKSGILRRIKRLTIPGSRRSSSDEFLNSFLSPQQCTSLIELDTRRVSWPLATTFNLAFPRLLRLQVDCQDLTYLSRLDLPALIYLNVERMSEIQEHLGHLRDVMSSPPSINLPELRSLQMKGWTLYWLMSFRVPKLESLHLDLKSASYGGFILLPPGVEKNGVKREQTIEVDPNSSLYFQSPFTQLNNVRRLTLISNLTSTITKADGATDAYITGTMQLLHSLPRVEYFQLINRDPLDSSFEHEILQHLIDGSQFLPLPVLPAMKDLTIGDTIHPSTSHISDITPIATRLFEMRKEKHMTLGQVRLHAWNSLGMASIVDFPQK
jgi:hypothetical protein